MKNNATRKFVPAKWVLFAFLFLLNFSRTYSQFDVPDYQSRIVPLFEAGVNISLLENYWSKGDVLLQKENFKKLQLAHKMGFKTVRVPIDFDLFLMPDKVTFNPDVIKKLTKVYEYINANNMTMILTYHFGVTRNGMAIEELQKEIQRGFKIWAQIINLFKGKGYDNLYFGLYDEPRTKTEDRWILISQTGIEKLRPLDPNRWWLVGTNNYMTVNAFNNLKPINDDKIIYVFHFYEPYIFTTQGAPWDKDKTYMTGLPYPYAASDMPPMPERAKADRDMTYNYEHYNEKANKGFIEANVKVAHDWSVRNNVPVICTETGTIKSIPEKYRNNYMNDVVAVMKSYGIPMVVWDLDQSFKITNANGELLSISF